MHILDFTGPPDSAGLTCKTFTAKERMEAIARPVLFSLRRLVVKPTSHIPLCSVTMV